jgi:hypothetical protein
MSRVQLIAPLKASKRCTTRARASSQPKYVEHEQENCFVERWYLSMVLFTALGRSHKIYL